MLYTKPMIELIYEIRRRMPSDKKPGIKMANPALLPELVEHYHCEAKAVTKALIKELMALAGDPWRQALETKPQPSEDTRAQEHFITKVYRGLATLEPMMDKNRTRDDKTTRKRRVYRGRVIEEA